MKIWNAILLSLALLNVSCAGYKSNIMFRTQGYAALKKEKEVVEKNYPIQKNDRLTLDVYTKNGERIIDPDLELLKEMNAQMGNMKPEITYTVDPQGYAKFPMVGLIKVEGATLRQAEEILQKEYTKFYQDVFVVLQSANRRVVVLGAPGGLVIPLPEENASLVEILALAKGVSNDARANNIRVLRGEEVYIADFSTIEGYRKGNIIIQPGDVIYVEPIRRPFVEGMRDYGPIISLVTGLTTLAVVLFNL